MTIKNKIIIIFMYGVLKLMYLSALITGLTLGVIYSIKPLWITCLVMICLYSCSITFGKSEEKEYVSE